MNNQNSKNEQLSRLNTQIAFISAIIFALSINIYIILGYKDLIINEKKSKFTIKQLYELSLLSSGIILIGTIYFFILAYEYYENATNRGTFDFYTAAVLSLIAQSIRYNTLIKYPNDIFGAEDII